MAITKINTPELLDINTTGAKQLPSGTTAQRPTTGVTAGDFRYNTTDDRVEYYDGTSPYDAAKWFQIDDEALPAVIPVGSEHFNVNTYSGTGATQTIDAKFNEAANFNGSSSHISTSNPLGTGNVAYSISAWIYLNDTSHTGGIYTIWDGGTTAGTYLFFKVDAGKISIGNYGGSVTSTNTLAVNQWVHVAVTRDTSNNVELYVNGSSDTTGTLTLNLGNHSPKIGALNNSVQNFNGKIDQVRIYITDLGATQVEDLYTDETTTTASSLSFPSGETATATYQLDGNGDDVSGTYSATSTTDIGYTGMKFAPDFVWIKRRDGAENHYLQDSVRGSTQQIYSNLTNSQFNQTDAVTSFNSNGFTMGSYNGINNGSETYVAWNWRAAGFANAFNVLEGGTVTTNSSAATAGITAGTITTGWNVSANRDAGFSIVKYTGNENANQTVGHGLSQAPEIVFTKQLDGTREWTVPLLSGFSTGNYLVLNDTNTLADDNNRWSSISSSTITIGASPFTNGTGSPYISYFFHSVVGFSKIGSYVGNNLIDGPEIVTGFRPAFVMFKATNANPGNTFWVILDNKRDGTTKKRLYANSDSAEDTAVSVDFLSNSFKIRTNNSDINANFSYIYLAIAS